MEILAAVPAASIVVPVQVLGELFNVLRRKAHRTADDAAAIVRVWQDMFNVVPTTETVLAHALDAATAHGLAIWDAIILAAASEGGCRALLSEDMHDGFTWSGVTIVDPFARAPDRLLDELLAGR